MKSFLASCGSIQHLSTTANKFQNEVTERLNRTIIEQICSMMHQKEVPNNFWTDELSVAAHVINWVTSRGISLSTKTYEIISLRKSNASYLRVFGSTLW